MSVGYFSDSYYGYFVYSASNYESDGDIAFEFVGYVVSNFVYYEIDVVNDDLSGGRFVEFIGFESFVSPSGD